MNQYYKQSVLVFGVIGPIVLILVLIVVAFQLRGKLDKTYKLRKDNFVRYEKVLEQREGLERRIREQEPHMNRWMSLYESATTSMVRGYLRDVQQGYDDKEFAVTSFRMANSNSGIGGASAQPSVQLQIGLRGTYRALQNALLEMETRMPHLQLDNVKFNRDPQQPVLNANVNYTAWQKE